MTGKGDTVYTDMLGREVRISKPVKRIVSLVPSQTEFLYDIGQESRLAGQTVFCVHPATAYRNAVKVGGTKKVRYVEIDRLNPDLIICNREENTAEMVEILAEKYPVWVSDIKNENDAFTMMRALSRILDAEESGEKMIDDIKKEFENRKIFRRWSCVYLIWRNPYMAAGPDTFIHSMLDRAGFDNMITEPRYPELTAEALTAINPHLVLLSSEPYPFSDVHAGEIRKMLPSSRVIKVDGEMFSWYGSRMKHIQAYFNELQRQLHKFR